MEHKKILEIAQSEVETIKKLLDVEASVSVNLTEGDEGLKVVNVEFSGDDLGYMIGNRGLHMQALQYILSNIIKNKIRKDGEEINLVVLVDIGGYREQRNSKIEKLALQKADDARILGDAIDLLPMSAGDRRIVHSTLSKFSDIKTESFGEGRDRYVRITPVSEKDLGVVSETDNSEITEE